MNKFTEGPWFVREWDGEDWPEKRISVGPEDYNMVSAVCISPRYVDREQALADANLIAAAPELYEELLNRYIQTKCGCGHPACNRCKDDKDTENVLARARGENNAQG